MSKADVKGHLELRADAPRCPAADPRPERKHGDLARRSLQASFRADEGILIPARSDYIGRCVGIGRRGGLKIRWANNPCGFDPRHRHHPLKARKPLI